MLRRFRYYPACTSARGARASAAKDVAGRRLYAGDFWGVMADLFVSGRRAQACADLARREGWDMAGLLKEEGIALEWQGQGWYRMSAYQAANLLKALWRKTGDEFLGLARTSTFAV